MTPGPEPETIASIGEFGLIERIRAVLASASGSPLPVRGASELLLGIGDDAAVVRPDPGWDLVLTCDTLVRGRHFDPRWMAPAVIGRRAMIANLSDIAAMGGEPRHALVALGLPGSMLVSDVEDLYRGFLEALSPTEATIVGGNLTGSGSEWFVNITLVGRIEPGRELTRAGARPGDRILVTGSPGRSAAGLAVLREATGTGDSSDRTSIDSFLAAHPWSRSLVRAFLLPDARLAAGSLLSRLPDRAVTAALDLSDGLAGDLSHICEQSGVRALVDASRFPADPDLDEAAAHFGRHRAAWTLAPGDDYELLFTVAPAASDRVATELRASTGLAVTEIGTILAVDPAPGPAGGERRPVEVAGLPPDAAPGAGWDHFRSRPKS